MGARARTRFDTSATRTATAIVADGSPSANALKALYAAVAAAAAVVVAAADINYARIRRANQRVIDRQRPSDARRKLRATSPLARRSLAVERFLLPRRSKRRVVIAISNGYKSSGVNFVQLEARSLMEKRAAASHAPAAVSRAPANTSRLAKQNRSKLTNFLAAVL